MSAEVSPVHSLHPTLDFADYIRRRTEDFTGRGWVFDQLGEWLAASEDPLFLITGGPGAGKSALAARLAQVSTGAAPSPHPELVEGFLSFAQFCQSGADPTLDPRELVLSLTRLVASRHPEFAGRLADQGAGNIHIEGPVTVGGEVHGTVTGVAIGTLNVGDMSARVAFNRLFRRPLEEARELGMAERIVVLIDALDESLSYARSENIVRLLEDVVDDLPDGVRLIVTSRPDDRVLGRLGPAALDVLEDAPGDDDDVSAYLRQALAGHDPTDEVVGSIAAAADGNFLYARHVAEAVRDGRLDPSPAGWTLPGDLQDIYREYCKREVDVDSDAWPRLFRPLLSALVAAQEPGLLRSHLRRVAGGGRAGEVDDALRSLSQFLVADSADGPFSLYHTSFRDFLEDFLEDNHVEPREGHEHVARLFLEAYQGAWDTCTDVYGLRWTPHHLERAVDGGDPVRDHALTAELVGLVTDPAYQKQMIAETGELAALRQALERAVEVAATDRRPEASLLVARAALATGDFEATHLRPEGLFDLARRGELDRALDRFELFSSDDAWRKAVMLSLIWSAGVEPSPRAQAIVDEIEAGEGEDALKQWARRVVGLPFETEPLPDPPDAMVVEAILERRGGSMDSEGVAEVLGRGPNAEMLLVSGLAGLGDEAPLYLAEADAPVLVAAAAADPALFTPRLLDYVALHAENRYAFYRNRSLWVILLTALRHPDDAWTRDLAERLCLAALAGGGADFREMLGMVVEARATADGAPLGGGRRGGDPRARRPGAGGRRLRPRAASPERVRRVPGPGTVRPGGVGGGGRPAAGRAGPDPGRRPRCGPQYPGSLFLPRDHGPGQRPPPTLVPPPGARARGRGGLPRPGASPSAPAPRDRRRLRTTGGRSDEGRTG
jgi:hypothetical protein